MKKLMTMIVVAILAVALQAEEFTVTQMEQPVMKMLNMHGTNVNVLVVKDDDVRTLEKQVPDMKKQLEDGGMAVKAIEAKGDVLKAEYSNSNMTFLQRAYRAGEVVVIITGTYPTKMAEDRPLVEKALEEATVKVALK